MRERRLSRQAESELVDAGSDAAGDGPVGNEAVDVVVVVGLFGFVENGVGASRKWDWALVVDLI